jgi:hypothetical protein
MKKKPSFKDLTFDEDGTFGFPDVTVNYMLTGGMVDPMAEDDAMLEGRLREERQRIKDERNAAIKTGIGIVGGLAGAAAGIPGVGSAVGKFFNSDSEDPAALGSGILGGFSALTGMVAEMGGKVKGSYSKTGLLELNGDSHDEPSGGIDMTEPGSSTYTLVEGGETMFNDFVYTNSRAVGKGTAKRFKLPKFIEGLTFADASKKLAEDFNMNPNNPNSKKSFEQMMARLEEAHLADVPESRPENQAASVANSTIQNAAAFRYGGDYTMLANGGTVDPEMKFRNKYNTDLTKSEQTAFNKWAQEESERQGRDILMDKGAYDVQGFWKSGDYKNIDKDGHGTDKWKKPNHPTFSNESIYHNVDGYVGGVWGKDGSYMPSAHTSGMYGADYYDRMFSSEADRPEHLHPFSKQQMTGSKVKGMMLENGGDTDPPEPPHNEIMKRQIYAESRFDPKAKSPADAKGLAQFRDITVEELKRLKIADDSFDPYDVDDAIMGHKAYMANLEGRPWIAKGDSEAQIAKALAAYNLGPKATLKELERIKKKGIDIYKGSDWSKELNKETRDYIQRALGYDEDFNKEYEQAVKSDKFKDIVDKIDYQFGGNKYNVLREQYSKAMSNVPGTINPMGELTREAYTDFSKSFDPITQLSEEMTGRPVPKMGSGKTSGFTPIPENLLNADIPLPDEAEDKSVIPRAILSEDMIDDSEAMKKLQQADEASAEPGPKPLKKTEESNKFLENLRYAPLLGSLIQTGKTLFDRPTKKDTYKYDIQSTDKANTINVDPMIASIQEGQSTTEQALKSQLSDPSQLMASLISLGATAMGSRSDVAMKKQMFDISQEDRAAEMDLKADMSNQKARMETDFQSDADMAAYSDLSNQAMTALFENIGAVGQEASNKALIEKMNPFDDEGRVVKPELLPYMPFIQSLMALQQNPTGATKTSSSKTTS